MRIGLCYDLAADWTDDVRDSEQSAEFDQPETIDAIEALLAAHDHRTERIGRAEQLVRRLAEGARWDLVFNICEGLHGIGRESLVPALLDAYNVPYVFSDPEVLALTLHKAHCKRVVRDAGIATADFRVIDDPRRGCDLPLPVFVKPLAEGTGKGIGDDSICRAPEQVVTAAARIIARFGQPALAESLLPGREFTVGVIGTGASAVLIGVVELSSEAAYGFDAKKNYEYVAFQRDGGSMPEEPAASRHARAETRASGGPTPVIAGSCPVITGPGFDRPDRAFAIGHDGLPTVSYRLATDREAAAAGAAALAAWRVLGGRDAGRIDLRSDAAGQPHFLEANPLAGLHPTDSDLTIAARLAGHDHTWLLTRIMDAACERLGLRWR